MLEATVLTGLGGIIGIFIAGMLALANRTFVPLFPLPYAALGYSGCGISVGVGPFFLATTTATRPPSGSYCLSTLE